VGAAAIDANVAIAISLTRLHHRGKKYASSDPASINRGTADGSNLQQRLLAVEAVDEIGFERRVRGEVESILRGNGCDSTGLLLSLQHGFDSTEVAGGAQDATLVAVVSGQHPKAILPGIVNYIVDMSDGALGEGVGDAPSRAGVGGGVDVNFLASGIVEVLSPEYGPTRHGGDV